MRKGFLKFRNLWGIAACLLCLTACEEEEQTKGGAETEKEATILVYMVGENDLSSYLETNIANMMSGYEMSDVSANILVYMDIDEQLELYLIDKNVNGTPRKSLVKTYADQMAVDPEVMNKVINEVFQTYPSKRKALILSSHADGSLYQQNTISKRSFGMEKKDGIYYGMNVTDLKDGLENIPYLDVLMFDACLMANVETAFELRDCAHYMLAAPNSVPAEGFPYHKIMPDLLKMDEASLKKVLDGYMYYFHHNNVQWDDFVAISLTDLTRMDQVALEMDSLSRVDGVEERIDRLVAANIQMYELGYELYDCGNWLDSIGGGSGQLQNVKTALEQAVVYKLHSDYASVSDWGTLRLPITDERYSGLNTNLPDLYITTQEVRQRSFFVTLDWYRSAGLWRFPVYNAYEE